MRPYLPIALVAVLVVISILAGCITREERKVLPPEPVTETQNHEGLLYNPDSGRGSDTFETTVTVNGTLEELTIVVSIKETDQNNTQTDEGSDPDTVNIGVDAGETVQQSETLTTEGSDWTTKTLRFTDENVSGMGLPREWRILLKGIEFGGGKNPTGPIGIFPIPFLVYIDQVICYRIEISYTYLPENA